MSANTQDGRQNTGYCVITINREYGALGRTFAALLSEHLGIPYYDRDFVKKTAEESGYEIEEINREGEELSTSAKLMDRFLGSAVSYKSSHEEIYKVEKKVILDLAKSPCIIVGRCADHTLREAGIPALSVYLTAPLENRIRRAVELAENGKTPIEKYVEERDKKRAIFYREYTGRNIEDASNYTICFDTGHIDISVCAEIVEKLYQDCKASAESERSSYVSK